MSDQLLPARKPANTFERLTVDTRAWITLRRTRGSRYYRAHLEQDLWSAWTVTEVNGRIGTPLGRGRHFAQPSIEAALLALANIAQRRRRRGYELNRCIRICGMHTVNEALTLLKRQAELETAMKRPGGIRITEEQELHHLRRRVGEFPDAARATLQAAHSLRRRLQRWPRLKWSPGPTHARGVTGVGPRRRSFS